MGPHLTSVVRFARASIIGIFKFNKIMNDILRAMAVGKIFIQKITTLFLTDKTFCVPQQESHTGFGNINDDRISFFV